MRIVYVGNYGPRHSTENHVAQSLESIGHQVTRLQENEQDWSTIAERSHDTGADLFLWTRTWGTPNDEVLLAFKKLERYGIPTVFYHLDRWWGLEREYQIHEEPFFRMSMVVSPDGGNDDRWREAGVNHFYLPPGVYGPECYMAEPNRGDWPHDIVFVGTYPYPHPAWTKYREDLILGLKRRYGPRFRRYPLNRSAAIRNEQLNTLYATAKVVVGDSCLCGDPPPAKYWSDRIPETCGRGGYLIHPEVVGLEEWYPDLTTYPLGDFNRLHELIDHALTHPEEREANRLANHELVKSRDTYAHRMQAVLDEAKRRGLL